MLVFHKFHSDILRDNYLNGWMDGWMGTEEMRQAMNTLRQFSEKEKNYFAYQARQDYIRQQNSIRLDSERKIEQERAEKEAAIQQGLIEKVEKEAAIQREQAERTAKEAALAEIERLKALLKNQSS